MGFHMSFSGGLDWFGKRQFLPWNLRPWAGSLENHSAVCVPQFPLLIFELLEGKIVFDSCFLFPVTYLVPSRRPLIVFEFHFCFLMTSECEEIRISKFHSYHIAIIQINSLLKKKTVLSLRMATKVEAGGHIKRTRSYLARKYESKALLPPPTSMEHTV